MRVRNPALVLTVLLFFFLPPSGHAQTTQSPVRETAEAVLVEVPVRVVDRDGKPIRNLTASDFLVFDDGKKQTILGLDAIDLAERGVARPAGGGEKLHPAARRHFLVLFDLAFSRPKAILAARRAAKEFVLSSLGDQDLAAVATYSVEAGVKLLVTFSSDRPQLARAIDTLGTSNPSNFSADPLAFAFDLRQWQRTGSQGSVGAAEAQASGMVETMQTLAALAGAREDEYRRGRVLRMTRSFGDLARVLDAVSGRKDIIYLSEGFESRLLVGAPETDQQKDWIVSGEQWKVDADGRFGNSILQTEMKNLTDLLRRSDCVVHAVDIGGIRTESGEDPVVPRRNENALFELASGTGGEVFRNTNDFRGQLERLVSGTNLVYVLAFRPERTGSPARFHVLKVKVNARGARVSARAGYYERRAFRLLSPLERSLWAADVIANEIPVDDIPARVLAAPFPANEDAASIPILLEVPGRALLAGLESDRVTVEIYVYAYAPDNSLRDFVADAVTVDLTRNRDRLVEGGLKYYGELSLPLGQYRLRTLVRNSETGRMGLSVSALRVPSFAARQPYVLPPIFLANPAIGISVRGRANRPRGAAESDGSALLDVAGGDLVPTALPQVHSGRSSPISVVAYHFGESTRDDALQIDAHVLSEEGRPLRAGSLALLGKSLVHTSGRRTLLLNFTPEGLAPGRYSLRIFLQDSVTGQAAHASAPFVLQ